MSQNNNNKCDHGAIHCTVFFIDSAKCHSLLYDSTFIPLFKSSTAMLPTTLHQQHTKHTWVAGGSNSRAPLPIFPISNCRCNHHRHPCTYTWSSSSSWSSTSLTSPICFNSRPQHRPLPFPHLVPWDNPVCTTCQSSSSSSSSSSLFFFHHHNHHQDRLLHHDQHCRYRWIIIPLWTEIKHSYWFSQGDKLVTGGISAIAAF